MVRLASCLVFLFVASTARADAPQDRPIDLTDATVVTAGLDASNGQVGGPMVERLLQHISKRSGQSWSRTADGRWPDGKRSVIAIGKKTDAKAWAGPLAGWLNAMARGNAAEGYSIVVDPKLPAVLIAGNDDRGVVFGIGRLLRELKVTRNSVRLAADLAIHTAPRQALRGHQLGYRPKTNSYDAWDAAQWQRYITDLAIFGTNAIELVPPRTDDDLTSPHFPSPPLEMMTHMSRTCASLDMQVWVWFPVMDPVDTEPDKTESLLKEWDEVFRALPRLDAVFVPGGDPGHIPAGPLFGFLEKAKAVLVKRHPKATIWVSPQGFTTPRFEEFLSLVHPKPRWLDGIVFGPQVRMPLRDLRSTLSPDLPIRGYPDITHSRQCQHPVPDWDLAFATTEGRESINPRPRFEAALTRAYAEHTVGFISYSEGCNDDVNKSVWSAVGWDPQVDVVDTLRQYSRVFLGEELADPFAQVLLGLERNWSGSPLVNGSINETLSQLRDLERSASPEVLRNWRFQQAAYRAYYDAYVRDRLILETQLEYRALEFLRNAGRLGSIPAMTAASATLSKALSEPVSADLRARVFELGDRLFQSIGMQLSVERHQAIEAERGANLDTIDTPLNERLYLEKQFNGIRNLPTEPERLVALAGLIGHADPGPGGFYDAPGIPGLDRHLVHDPPTEFDPMFVRATFHGFALRPEWPRPWRQYAMGLFDAPIRLAYHELDPNARYRVRVVYAGDSPRARMNLMADGHPVHTLLPKPDPIRPVEFPIPHEATADGSLTLTWNQEPGRGGNGRGNQVCEVWLIRER